MMKFDSLWSGQVAMAALAQIAFAVALGSLLSVPGSPPRARAPPCLPRMAHGGARSAR